MQIGEALLCVCGTVCTTDPLDKEQNVYITVVQDPVHTTVTVARPRPGHNELIEYSYKGLNIYLSSA